MRDLRATVGGQRSELAFVLIGGVVAIAFSLVISVPLFYLIGPERAIWFAPFQSHPLHGRHWLRDGRPEKSWMSAFCSADYLVYAAAIYLLGLYALVWWLVATALHSMDDARSIAHVAAAIVIAFAMAPARGVSRQLAERLFISTQSLDFRGTMKKATDILSSITTLHDLLQRFGGTIAEAVSAERVLILLEGRESFTTQI